jgi:AcrR family transcriptional regulator
VLRERILSEGSVLLGEAGITPSLYHVNMEELIRRVGVPRSSVFAAFGGKEELITELMVRLLRPTPDTLTGFSPGTAAAAQAVIDKHATRMRHADGSRDLEGEYAVLREAVRIVLAYNTDEFIDSTEWHTFMALSASVESLPPGRRERVTEALREADATFTTAMVDFYGTALSSLGRRMRPGLEWRHLVTAGAGMVEGTVARRRFGAPVASETIVLPGIDGEPVEWTLVAVAYLAMLEGLTEVIPL